jgi:hypothetical protein
MVKPFAPMLVAMVLAAGCSSHGDYAPSPTNRTSVSASSASQPGTAGHGGDAASNRSPDPNYAPALAKAELTLAALPTLPHATRRSSAPVAEQADPIVAKGTPYLVDLTAFWTAPGDAIDAISYLTAHRPPRTGIFPGTYTGPIGPTRVTRRNDPQSLSYEVPSATDPLIITFDVVALGADVSVRADVEVRWHGTKPISEYLGTVRSVDILMLRPGAGTDHRFAVPTVRRALTGAQAQTVANIIDAMPLQNIFDTSCRAVGRAHRTCWSSTASAVPSASRTASTTALESASASAEFGNQAWTARSTSS